MIEKQYEEVTLKIYKNRSEMGKSAAVEAAKYLKKQINKKGELNCIFAAAPSQNEFLTELIKDKSIDWSKVNAYHMDEYIGFGLGHPKSFNKFLTDMIFSKVPFKSINLINGENENEVERYGKLLDEITIDVSFIGIGENGHIAFNDPEVADFKDKKTFKVVELDNRCRTQQVNDGCFDSLDEVPKYALTVTIPKLVSASKIFCIVPTEKKLEAVKRTLLGEISEQCPASILRRVKNVTMYIDEDCYWESL